MITNYHRTSSKSEELSPLVRNHGNWQQRSEPAQSPFFDLLALFGIPFRHLHINVTRKKYLSEWSESVVCGGLCFDLVFYVSRVWWSSWATFKFNFRNIFLIFFPPWLVKISCRIKMRRNLQANKFNGNSNKVLF